MVMPDLLHVFVKRWKLILAISSIATVVALIFSILSPKKYLSVTTALPVNSMIADKARIFNPNIQFLYSDFGTADELDRIEGTARLDTIFLAASKELHLSNHYGLNETEDDTYRTAMWLKNNTRINRSSYGELKVKVWDGDPAMAAQLANFLMQRLQELHQHLQSQTNITVLEKIKQQYAVKQKELSQLKDNVSNNKIDSGSLRFTVASQGILETRISVLSEQLSQYERLIGEYELAISANTPVLLIVENARPPLKADKPKVVPIVLFTFFASLLFSFLIGLFIEGRKSLS